MLSGKNIYVSERSYRPAPRPLNGAVVQEWSKAHQVMLQRDRISTYASKNAELFTRKNLFYDVYQGPIYKSDGQMITSNQTGAP
jgi:hypothetical protein